MKKFILTFLMVFASLLFVSCGEDGYERVDCHACDTTGKVSLSCTKCTCTNCHGTGRVSKSCNACFGLGGTYGFVYEYNFMTGKYESVWKFKTCYFCVFGYVNEDCSFCVNGYKGLACAYCKNTRYYDSKCETCNGKGYTLVEKEETNRRRRSAQLLNAL